MDIQVVLTQDVKKLGFTGDIVKVSAGYARNFLFPKRFAVDASPAEIQKAEQVKAHKVKSRAEMMAKASEVMESLAKMTLVFAEKVSEEGHLYGSVAEKDIAAKLKTDAKLEVEKNQVEMPNGHIKEVGMHEVKIHLFEGKTVSVKVEVKAEK